MSLLHTSNLSNSSLSAQSLSIAPKIVDALQSYPPSCTESLLITLGNLLAHQLPSTLFPSTSTKSSAKSFHPLRNSNKPVTRSVSSTNARTKSRFTTSSGHSDPSPFFSPDLSCKLDSKSALQLATDIVNIGLRVFSKYSSSLTTTSTFPNDSSNHSPDQNISDISSHVQSFSFAAKCTSLALSYLTNRFPPDATISLSNLSHSYPLEHALVSLTSKFLFCQMNDLALSQLITLRLRLEQLIFPGVPSRLSSLLKPSNIEHSTIMLNLLRFNQFTATEDLSLIVIMHQLCVLRLMTTTPDCVSCSLDLLNPNSTSSPCATMLWICKTFPGSQDKICRHMECLSQSLLNFCPSVCQSQDLFLVNNAPEKRVSAHVAFQLQMYALCIRCEWYKLFKRKTKSDAESELLHSCDVFYTAFARRCLLNAHEKYLLASTCYSEFMKRLSGLSDKPVSSDAILNIHSCLSHLASATGKYDEAIKWVEKSRELNIFDLSKIHSAKLAVRYAALHLKIRRFDNTIVFTQALESLGAQLSGSSSMLESLLTEVVILRKYATLLLSELNESYNESLLDMRTLAFRLILATVKFIRRFIVVQSGVSSKVKDNQYIPLMECITKHTKSFLDSALLACRYSLNWFTISYAEFRSILVSSMDIYHQHIQGITSNDGNSGVDVNELSSFPVTVSCLFWTYFQNHIRETGNHDYAQCPSNCLDAMKRSTGVLDSCSVNHKIRGNYALKLIFQARLLRDMAKRDDCRNIALQALREMYCMGLMQPMISSGVKQNVEQVLGSFNDGSEIKCALRLVMCPDKNNSLSVHSGCATDLDFIDNPEVRGMLLEYELAAYCEAIEIVNAKSTGDRMDLLNDVTLLGRSLVHDIYDEREFPLRRLRVCTLLLRALSCCETNANFKLTSHDNRLFEFVKLCQTEHDLFNTTSSDVELSSYSDHWIALFKTELAMLNTPVNVEMLRDALDLWYKLCSETRTTTSTGSCIGNYITDVPEWIRLLQGIFDFFESQNLRMDAIKTGKLLVMITHPTNSTSGNTDVYGERHIEALSNLGRAFLRSGQLDECHRLVDYMTGLVKNKADLMNNHEVKVRMLLVEAEFYLQSGRFSEFQALLHTLDNFDTIFNDAISSLGSLTKRQKFARDISDYLMLLSTSCAVDEVGQHDKALYCVRRSCMITLRVWGQLERGFELSSRSSNAKSDTSRVNVNKGQIKGVIFWSLSWRVIESLIHLADTLSLHGILSESIYWLDQAHRVATAIGSPNYKLRTLILKARLTLRGGRVNEAENIVKQAQEILRLGDSDEEQIELLLLKAELNSSKEHYTQSIEFLDKAIEKCDDIINGTLSVEDLDCMDSLGDMLSRMSVGPRTNTVKGKTRTKLTNSTKSRRKIPPKSPSTDGNKEKLILNNAKFCQLKKRALEAKAYTIINHLYNDNDARNSLDVAIGNLTLNCSDNSVNGQILQLHLLTRNVLQLLSNDVIFGVLSDSCLSYPAFEHEMVKLDGTLVSNKLVNSSESNSGLFLEFSTRKTGNNVGIDTKKKLGKTLITAWKNSMMMQDRVLQAQSPRLIRQFCGNVTDIMILLSIVSSNAERTISTLPHPIHLAFNIDLPNTVLSKRKKEAISIEKSMMDGTKSTKLIQWPCSKEILSSTTPSSTHDLSPLELYSLESLPDEWIIVSLSLNERRDELFIVRYDSKSAPFVVRLPLIRHYCSESGSGDDGDSDDDTINFYSFDNCKAELSRIITLSNASAHQIPDPNIKGAKTKWWKDRAELDARLEKLLFNIENTWFRGFKGIFSSLTFDQEKIERFKLQLHTILNRHLPSRSRRRRIHPKLDLDSRVLNLFFQLGVLTPCHDDYDDQLMDLLCFVVDIFQFSGEQNAYDEIDFDSLTLDTKSVLQEYLDSSLSNQYTTTTDITSLNHQSDRHVILILDKPLHSFPWECLPCLINSPVSRLPSFEALKCRIASLSSQNLSSSKQAFQIFANPQSGISILNPSGDLVRTQSLLQPYISSLKGDWQHYPHDISNPSLFSQSSESIISNGLLNRSIYLYFGHGSCAQYIRPRTVRNLPQCATSWLIGCSSGAIIENGFYEPSGMVMSFLTAGAPAVLGALWDITDKDCDRFSISCGHYWGLWKYREIPPSANDLIESNTHIRKFPLHSLNLHLPPTSPQSPISLVRAVTEARKACLLKYLNGAAMVVYGIPVYLNH